MQFSSHGSMLSKTYLENCLIGDQDKKPISMIKYDKGTFSVINCWQKICILDSHDILYFKEKGKRIIVSFFSFIIITSKLKIFIF